MRVTRGGERARDQRRKSQGEEHGGARVHNPVGKHGGRSQGPRANGEAGKGERSRT